MSNIEPSLLDKLFDENPRQPASGSFKHLSHEQYKDSVARDIESLLNSRYVLDEELVDSYPECRVSLLSYGIRDFAGLSLASSRDRAYICGSLEQAISRHDQRLTSINVVLNNNQKTTGALQFSINALLILHPSREPISFDAMLQPSTLQYSVSRNRRTVAA